LEWNDTDERFDNLKWWAENRNKFPIVVLMTKEILVVPISTIAVKQAFSIGRNILSETRTSMARDVVEIQSCLNDWTKVEDHQ
jgi:hypothetical protein